MIINQPLLHVCHLGKMAPISVNGNFLSSENKNCLCNLHLLIGRKRTVTNWKYTKKKELSVLAISFCENNGHLNDKRPEKSFNLQKVAECF